MEVLKYLKQIYSGENALQNHVMLFAIAGIVSLASVKLLASWGNALFLNFFALPPHNHYEMFIYIFILVFAFLYLIGYFFQYMHSISFSKEANLIDFNLKSYLIFFRAFPMFFLWQNYLLIVTVIGVLILLTLKTSVLLYLFAAIILCCIPFMHLILVKFSDNFKYSKELLKLSTICKYIDRYLGSVCMLVLEVILLAILFCVILYAVKYCSVLLKNDNAKFAVKLFTVSLFTYLACILKLVYIAGLSKILKSKTRI